MHKREGRQIVITSVAIACLVAFVFSAIYYAHRGNDGAAVGTASSSLPNSQTPLTTHNTSPTTSSCPNGEPPMALNIGGNTVEACNQSVDGTVTAVSSTSITVESSDTNKSQTFTIASSTRITHQGQTLTASDIKVGDTVLIIPSNTNANEAWYLLVNPTFQGA